MDVMSVNEVAAKLAVSPDRVRALVNAGDLPAEKVAGRWLVDRAALAEFEDGRDGRRRAMSPRMAWALIGMVDRGAAEGVSRVDRARLRQRLRARPELRELAQLLRARADVRRLRVHPGGLDRVRVWPGGVASGLSGRGHDIVAADHVELYLPAEGVVSLREALGAVDVPAGDSNVIVRVPAVGEWPFPDGEAGELCVAVDLWDAGDSRSRREARRLYEQALSAGRFER